ncbi:MAG TPA: hypothetical protein VFJ81_17155, partial [Gemmatimonadales bacterium]|nr:hypothetical protein [Gemmatimonadales bacterium]
MTPLTAPHPDARYPSTMTPRASSTRRRVLSAAVSLLLFAGAVYVLRAELHDHPLHEILAELRS